MKNFFQILIFIIYNILLSAIFLILFIPLSIFLIVKKHNLSKRLGLTKLNLNKDKKTIWFHCASMGELNVFYSIFHNIKKNYDYNIVVTTTSITGYNKAKTLYKEADAITLLPFDIPFLIIPFILRIKPDILILIETELWPNLIFFSKLFKSKITLINARLSRKNFRKYYKIKFFWDFIISKIDLIIAKSLTDEKKFNKIINQKINSFVIENIKNASLYYKIKHTKSKLNFKPNKSDFVICFGSIREKEENDIIDIIKELVKENITVIFAPRHLSRLKHIEKKLINKNLTFDLFSSNNYNNKLILIDTMGILLELYKISNIAFVGGTLYNYGGHNILEPVLNNTPVLYGPYTSNCTNEKKLIEHFNCGIKITNKSQLLEKLLFFYSNKEELQQYRLNINKLLLLLEKTNKEITENIKNLLP